jgi:RNA polymerase sigma factor (TIGR02999 family)
MDTTPPTEMTALLRAWGSGDKSALDRLLPLIYDELRRLAAHYLRAERPDHTLQPTALVHEAYLRLSQTNRMTLQDRAHFFRLAAEMMRRVLVDHARKRRAAARGGGETKVALDEALGLAGRQELDLLALDDALSQLAVIDPQPSRVVELKFFGGLSNEETAEALGVSPATVKRDWAWAKAWLHQELSRR